MGRPHGAVRVVGMTAFAACLALAGCQRAARPAETDALAPGRITGKVLDGGGNPAVGAQVGVLQGVVPEARLEEVTLDHCYSTTTDANGALTYVAQRDGAFWRVEQAPAGRSAADRLRELSGRYSGGYYQGRTP